MTKNLKKKNLKDVNKIFGFFVHDEPLTIYKSGNSKVVTIPAEFPFEIGDVLNVSYEGESIKMVKKVKVKDNSAQSELAKLQKKYAGNFGDMSIDELEEFLEGIYE